MKSGAVGICGCKVAPGDQSSEYSSQYSAVGSSHTMPSSLFLNFIYFAQAGLELIM
jgi:hypothetical protein